MGQKVHPYGFRLGVVKTWKSKWYEDKNYAKWLHEDLKLKTAIRKKFAHAGIADPVQLRIFLVRGVAVFVDAVAAEHHGIFDTAG